MKEITIDAPRLYHDLQDHFGTANATVPWIASTHWLNMALAELDTMAENDDWEGICEIAVNEGFDLSRYEI